MQGERQTLNITSPVLGHRRKISIFCLDFFSCLWVNRDQVLDIVPVQILFTLTYVPVIYL